MEENYKITKMTETRYTIIYNEHYIISKAWQTSFQLDICVRLDWIKTYSTKSIAKTVLTKLINSGRITGLNGNKYKDIFYIENENLKIDNFKIVEVKESLEVK